MTVLGNNDYQFIINGKSKIFLDGYQLNSGISLKDALKTALSKSYQHFASRKMHENIEHFLFQIRDYGIFIEVK